VLAALSWWRLAGSLMAAATVWLLVWSLPVASDALRLSLESRSEIQEIDDLPLADAVVVLGGGVTPAPSSWPYPDLRGGADRMWHAARIYRAGRAPLIIISGGQLPWQGDLGSEAEAMRQFLADLGVPADAIMVEDRSRNTRENAQFTAALLRERGIDQVLLVTSALHMPRALATFRAAGVNTTPAASDFEVVPVPDQLLRWLPDAQALSDSTRALKEYLGLWAYRWRGWAE
jgi:uncharacterized SAM-binding protein YcdF (DUF218 family)